MDRVDAHESFKYSIKEARAAGSRAWLAKEEVKKATKALNAARSAWSDAAEIARSFSAPSPAIDAEKEAWEAYVAAQNDFNLANEKFKVALYEEAKFDDMRFTWVVACPHCDGSGFSWEDSDEWTEDGSVCDVCEGRGEVRVQVYKGGDSSP